jgi:LPXTG-motif cell wall-anchored protein
MRIQRRIFTLAAAATLATSAPAYGFDAEAPEGPSVIPTAAAPQRQAADDSDWLIAAGAAGALAVGGGVIVRRRNRSTTQPQLGAASTRGAARMR